MSTGEYPSFWRIYRAGEEQSTECLKDGDRIRLCWVFSDQTTGYRDYLDESFGRGRVVTPEKLFMKVPFPRFEWSEPGSKENNTISLIMSAAETINPILQVIQTVPENRDPKTGRDTDAEPITYNLHDLVLRLDSVGM